MSKKTLGLFDDPLGLGNNDDNNNDKKKGLTSLFDNNNNQDDIGLFKTLDSSKINLKKDKNQGKIIAIQPPIKIQNAAEKGLGFSTSLWDNNDNVTNTKKLDDLFNDTTTSLLSNDTTTSLFSNKNDIKKNDDALADIGIKINPIQINTSSGKVNTGNLDDNKLDDLKVGKLIEKEDDLDFELFGKKNIVQARSVGTILHKQKNISENEDLEVESAEVLEQYLEKVTLKDNVFTTIATKKVSQSPVITPTVNTDDIDISKFDINAYINENSNQSGGLFD